MPITRQFLEARAAEQHRRLLTHLRVAAPLVLWDRRRGREGRVPQVPLTERHRLELLAAGNAFYTGALPLLGDVFQFAWRCHPLFHRPDGALPNRRGAAGWGVRLRSLLARRLLLRRVRRCDLFRAEVAVRDRLREVEQDAQNGVEEMVMTRGGLRARTRRSPVAPDVNYFDSLVDGVGRAYGLRPDEVLDLPRALLNQLARTRLLESGDGDFLVTAPSDALLRTR